MGANMPPPEQPQPQAPAGAAGAGLPPDLMSLLAQTTGGMGGMVEPDDTIGGFFAPQGDPLPEGWHPPQALPPGHQPAPPNALQDPYREGDEYAILNTMPTELLIRYQDQFVAMGLARDVIPGQIDDGTAHAMRSLMAMGNRAGKRWQDVYTDVTRRFEAGEFGPEEEPDPVLVRRDPAELAQRARKIMEDELGRDIDDSELQAAAAVWAGFDLESAKQQVELESRDGSAMKNEMTLVNPEARFNEWFEGRYRPEIERRESMVEADESREFTMSQIGRIDQMIGGQ